MMKLVLAAAATFAVGVTALPAPSTPSVPVEVVQRESPYQDILNATFRVEMEMGTGSGTAVSPHHVLTNFHVAGKEGEHTLRAWVKAGGKTYPVIFKAKVVASDEALDLALLAIDGEWPGAVAALSDGQVPLQAGDSVFAAGAPLGKHPLVTRGEVLLPVDDDKVQGLRHIVASAPVVPGSSGGALWRRLEGGRYEMVGVTRALALVPMGFGVNIVPHLAYFIPLAEVRGFLVKNGVAV